MSVSIRSRFVRLLPGFDTCFVLVALLNWWHIWQHANGFCGGIAPPWYCDFTWYFSPNRLLLSAFCVRSRYKWLELAGGLCSAHLLAGQLFYFCNTDEFVAIADNARIDGVHVWYALLDEPIFQGCLALVLAPVGLARAVSRFSGGTVPARLRRATLAFLGFLILGYLSNFVSERASERAVEMSWPAVNVKPGPNEVVDDSPPRSYFVAPFMISVKEGATDTLVFAFFGFAKIVRKDSTLWFRAIPYLWPY